jgi:hypothetical protein
MRRVTHFRARRTEKKVHITEKKVHITEILMAAAAAFVAKSGLSPKPLSFWVEQEAFLQNQLKEKPAPNNVNVPGLESKKSDDGRITFRGSAFQRLSSNTYKMREDVKKLTGDVPSYTQLLADQQDYFYPYFVMIPGDLDSKLFAKLRELRHKEEEEQERIAGKPLSEFSYSLGRFNENALYRGDYNDLIDEIVTDERENLLLGHIRNNLLPRILSLENNGRPLCVYFFNINKYNSLHALGGIFWKKDGVVQIGLYDTIYFERHGTVVSEYISTIYIAWKLLFREVGVPYHIVNLSKLCLETAKGIHCIQYVMDAQYCSIYVFYFFYLYAKHNYPTDIEDIKKVIYETYVVNPENLTRDAHKYTNIFRLTLIHFAMNTILLYTNDPERHKETYNVYNDILEKTGYRLLTDDMYAIAKAAREASSINGGGQRRKTTRRHKQRVQKKSRRLRR